MPERVNLVGIPVEPEKPHVQTVKPERRKPQVETGFVTVKELAERMDMTTAGIRKWIKNGERRAAFPDDLKDTIPVEQTIPPEYVKKQGRRWLISLEWVNGFKYKKSG